MGHNFATELATGGLAPLIGESSLTLENQIAIHFSSNCYPPIPQFMVAVAVEAIKACNNNEPAKDIELPAGVSFRDNKTVSASEAVDSLRLEAWLIEQENN